MAGKAMSEEAGRELVNTSKSKFAGSIALSGLQIQLKNAQTSPAVLSSATIPTASGTAPGAMSAADKAKLDGVQSGANNYTLPVAGKALGGVKTTSDVASAAGYTPSPIVDGVVYYKDTLYPPASQTAPGTMSAEDKKKLDGIETGATNVIVDDWPENRSQNAVSSHGVYAKLQDVQADLSSKAPLASPALSGTPTAPTPSAADSSTKIATTAFVQAAVREAVTGASAYQGGAESYAAIIATDYKPGWYWVVKTPGAYAGQACEAGDMVFANTAKGSTSKDSDFDIIQSNIDFVTAADVKGWF